MCNLFKVGKIYKDSKLYLQDIQSLIKTDDTDVKWINVTVVRNKKKVKTSKNTVYNFLQITLAINTVAGFDNSFESFKIFYDLIWHGKLFRIFGPDILKLFLPKVTWL